MTYNINTKFPFAYPCLGTLFENSHFPANSKQTNFNPIVERSMHQSRSVLGIKINLMEVYHD